MTKSIARTKGKTQPSLSLRIDIDAERRIGPGKIELLEMIDAHGSISAAGRAMNMSYKRAWDLVDEINNTFSKPAVASQTGGKQGGGATLTPFGKLIVESYRKSEKAAVMAVRSHLAVLGLDI